MFLFSRPVAGLLLTLCFPLHALADSAANEFSGMLGAGVGIKPKYSGADDADTRVRPVIRLDYGPFFFGSVDNISALGWKFGQTAHWTFSTGVGSDFFPRQESDDDHLRGMGDIDVTPRAFLAATWRGDWLRAGAVASQDVGGNDQGFRFTTYAHLQWQTTDNLRVFAGPTLSWANGDYLQTQYGVDAGQSARSGLQRYEADSGLENIGIEAGVDYQLTPTWVAGFRASALRLEKEAADSPVVQDKNQMSYGLFVASTFGQ